MKTVIFKYISALLLLGLMGWGCEKEGISQSELNGKWILLGFGDDSTNDFISEPESEPKSSYVVFDNGKMDAFSVSNRTIDMGYLIKEGSKLSIISGKLTLVGGDTDWGQKFLTLIDKSIYYELNDSILDLYYENHKFMKFKKATK